MQINIDFRSGIPIYVQICDQIKHQVAAGELKPGDQLPTVRQMAADLRVNFNTIARAYRILDEEGLISTQHGRGTFILPPQNNASVEQLRRRDIQWLARHFLNQAARLNYSPAEVKEICADYLETWIETGSPPAEHET